MSRPVYVKYEEDADCFTYDGVETRQPASSLYSMFEMTEVVSQGSGGTVEFTFNGTSVAFVGETPYSRYSQQFSVSVDGGDPYNASYGDSVRIYGQWYQSPMLPDGNHTVRLSNFEFMIIDYALVTAGDSTHLQGDRVLVVVDDDDATYFTFTGDWTRNSSMIDSVISSQPVGNATHRSRTVGDELSFRFNGTSVGLYGVMLWNVLEPMVVNYTLDGFFLSQASYAGVRGPGANELPNYELFLLEGLSPTEHELVMTITGVESEDRAFILDYAVYAPSFTSIREMQGMVKSSVASSAVPTETPSSAVPTNTSSADSGATPVGTIVGAVIGGVALLVVIGLVAWWLIRRRKLRSGLRERDDNGYLPASMSNQRPLSGANGQVHQSESDSSAYLSVGSRAVQPSPHMSKSQVVLHSATGLSNTVATARSTPLQEEPRVQMQGLDNRNVLSNSYSSSAAQSHAHVQPIPGHATPTNRDYEAEIYALRRQIEVLSEIANAPPPAYDDRNRDRIRRAGSISVRNADQSQSDNAAGSSNPIGVMPDTGKRSS